MTSAGVQVWVEVANKGLRGEARRDRESSRRRGQ